MNPVLEDLLGCLALWATVGGCMGLLYLCWWLA
jgi:hypothetical protein